jgi:hypothetical protein
VEQDGGVHGCGQVVLLCGGDEVCDDEWVLLSDSGEMGGGVGLRLLQGDDAMITKVLEEYREQ